MNNRLYVGNLPWTTTEEQLVTEFGTYGTVSEAKIIFDHQTNRSKGFGFVTMETPKQAEEAMASLDGKEFGGRQLRVSIAEERARQPRSNIRGGRFDQNGGGYRRNERY